MRITLAMLLGGFSLVTNAAEMVAREGTVVAGIADPKLILYPDLAKLTLAERTMYLHRLDSGIAAVRLEIDIFAKKLELLQDPAKTAKALAALVRVIKNHDNEQRLFPGIRGLNIDNLGSKRLFERIAHNDRNFALLADQAQKNLAAMKEALCEAQENHQLHRKAAATPGAELARVLAHLTVPAASAPMPAVAAKKIAVPVKQAVSVTPPALSAPQSPKSKL